MDRAISAPISSCTDIVDAYLIKEESDPRSYTEGSDNDKYYFSATMEAYDLIKFAVSAFKKK